MAKNRKTASQAASKWHTRVGQSGSAYSDGVSASGVDWAGAATAPAASKLRNANLMAAINDGSIDAGITKAGNTKWRANTIAKGVPAWQAQTSSQAAQTAYQNAMTTVEGDYAAADTAMNNAGDGSTTASRIARAAAWATAMHEAKVKRGSRA